MRIPSGVTDQYIYFVAVDSADYATRETGLTGFTVYRSRNGAAAAAMTTPTINETDSTNMPGVYELLLDEDMTIGSGNDSEEMAFHITVSGMAPVTRTIELYRPKITAGNTLGVASDGDISGNLDGTVATVTTNTDMRGTDNAFLAASAPTNFSSLSISAGGIVDSNVEEIDAVAQAATNLEILMDGNEGFYGAYAGPRGPGVYFNDAAGNTSTTNGVDGTIGNPVSSVAAAKTLADSMSLDRIYIFNDSTATLAATMEDYEFVGLGEASLNTVALASQDVDQSSFHNLTITGIQAGTQRAQFNQCIFGAATVHAFAFQCGLTGTLTMSDNDDNILDQCFSMVAGNGTPTLDGGSGANLDVSVRHYSGGLEFANMSATSTASYESEGQVVVNANCNSGFALTVRGNCSITDNASLSSLTRDAAYNKTDGGAAVWDDTASGHTTAGTFGAQCGTDIDAILADSNELQTDWADGGRLDLILDARASQTSVDTVDTVVDGIQTDLDNATDGLGALKTLIDAIQTEVEKLTTTAHSEPTGVPAANESPINKLAYLFMALRNQVDVTSTKKTFYDDGGTGEWEKDLSDNGTTYSESEANAI